MKNRDAALPHPGSRVSGTVEKAYLREAASFGWSRRIIARMKAIPRRMNR